MLTFKVHTDLSEKVAQSLAKATTKAEHTLAIQVRKDTSPFVPALTGSLDIRTRVEGNMVVYPGPYARYLYHGKLMVDSNTGSAWAPLGGTKVVTDQSLVFTKEVHPQAQAQWFEVSKAQNMNRWLKTASKAVKREYE